MARLVEDIGDRQIAGLGTPEVRRGKVRIGFKMIDLATGEEEILASTWASRRCGSSESGSPIPGQRAANHADAEQF